MNNEALSQAFDIWFQSRPNLSSSDAHAANAGGQYRELAKRIFFSDQWAFKRWLIISGFGEFISSRSTEVDDDTEAWDYTEPKHISNRENATDVIKSLWYWMQVNKKQLSHG